LRRLGRPGRLSCVAGVVAIALLLYAGPLVPFFRSQGWLLAARLGGGEAAIERAIVAAPRNFLPYRAHGDWLRERGESERARRAYEHAAALNAQDLQTQLRRLELVRLGGASPATFTLPTDTDANVTYDWAWRRLPIDRPRFEAAEPAPGQARGFYAAESDGERTFRWTLGEAQVRIDQPGADTLVLTLRADRPGLPVAVSYAGRHLEVLEVAAEWREYRIALPVGARAGDGPRGVLTLRTETHVVGVEQPYPRGVALAAVWLETRGP
jgi:uncharacterized protein (TIGR02996 family)